jgi:uncharacterized protein (UPF0335 family)
MQNIRTNDSQDTTPACSYCNTNAHTYLTCQNRPYQDTTSIDEQIEAIFARIWNGDYYQSHEETLEDCKQAIIAIIKDVKAEAYSKGYLDSGLKVINSIYEMTLDD